MLDANAFSLRNVRRFGIFDGQKDISLVKHFVVLQIVQQRGGGVIWITGEKDGRA